MKPLSFFDCNCSIGMRTVFYPGSFYKVSDLLKKMDYYGIKKAVVYHCMAKEYDPVTGNEKLTEEIKTYSSLYPLWVIMPHHTGEFSEPGRLIRQMKKHGVKVVRVFPHIEYHNYSIARWNTGELFSALQAYNVPLMMGLEQTNWNEIYELCSMYPGLKVIITGICYNDNRNLYPLLQQFQYLYIETSMYKVHHGIEEICGKFGAHRLVFGTGMPVYSGGAAVSMINYAKISEKEKRLIAHENMESIMEGVRL